MVRVSTDTEGGVTPSVIASTEERHRLAAALKVDVENRYFAMLRNYDLTYVNDDGVEKPDRDEARRRIGPIFLDAKASDRASTKVTSVSRNRLMGMVATEEPVPGTDEWDEKVEDDPTFKPAWNKVASFLWRDSDTKDGSWLAKLATDHGLTAIRSDIGDDMVQSVYVTEAKKLVLTDHLGPFRAQVKAAMDALTEHAESQAKLHPGMAADVKRLAKATAKDTVATADAFALLLDVGEDADE